MQHYQSLGLKFDVTQEEIKSAYRRLAGVHHPDRGGSPEVFHRIQSAYEAIGDAKSSLAAAIMRKFILLIPLIYLLPLLWKDNPEYAVYLAEPISDFLAVTFTSVLFYVQSKKAMKRISSPEGTTSKEETGKK